MGNITNLATTGKYAKEIDGILVSFNFEVDNVTKALKKILDGAVVDTNGGQHYGTFNAENHANGRIRFHLQVGKEVQLVSIISAAIEDLEAKVTNGEIVVE